MWKCQHCGEEIEADFNVCWNCQYGKNGTPPSPAKPEVREPLRRDPSTPSDGERMFAWLFCSIFFLLVLGGVGILVIFGMGSLLKFKEAPVIGPAITILIIWAIRHSAPNVSRVLVRTRGMSIAQRLRKIMAAIAA